MNSKDDAPVVALLIVLVVLSAVRIAIALVELAHH